MRCIEHYTVSTQPNCVDKGFFSLIRPIERILFSSQIIHSSVISQSANMLILCPPDWSSIHHDSWNLLLQMFKFCLLQSYSVFSSCQSVTATLSPVFFTQHSEQLSEFRIYFTQTRANDFWANGLSLGVLQDGFSKLNLFLLTLNFFSG